MTDFSLPLSDPDISETELAAVMQVMQSPRLSQGAQVERFEQEFAAYHGRRYAVAVTSGTIGLMLALKAHGIGHGDEVIVSPYSWRETAHAVTLAGATPVFADIDYWSGTLAVDKVAAAITTATRAVIGSNTNGHPAPWAPLRALAEKHGLALIEDSTEAIGSRYAGQLVGSFGACAVFDFSQPGPLCCGEGGMVLTDDGDLARAMRYARSHRPEERASIVMSATVPLQCGLSDIAAALGLAQLQRLDEILARRKLTEHWYFTHIKSFEGIKDPYVATEVTEVHWFLYLVHLGTRFSRSSRDAIVEDLRTESIEASAYCQPLHRQRAYLAAGAAAPRLAVTEKVADRAVALPFNAHLTDERIAFIVRTMKDASINVGAGSAIYL